MENIKSLLKLEFKINRKNGEKIKNTISSILFAILTICLMGVISYFVITSLFLVGGSNKKGLFSFIILALQVIIFFYTISNQLKIMFLYKDKVTLSYIPVSKWQIYMAKYIYCLIQTYLVNFLICLPVMISLCFVFSLQMIGYFISIFIVLILPLLPYALATLCVTPLMFVYNWLKNKNALKLIISVVLTVVGFYFYMQIVFNVATLTLLKDVPTTNLIDIITSFCSTNYLPSTWFANILFNYNVWFYIIIVLILSVMLNAIGALLGATSYLNIFNRALVEKDFSKHIVTKSKPRQVFWAYFITEFKDLFRNSNYSFTYFGMTVAMPIMVWYCNKFILDFATEKIGENIVLGTTLLVIFIFVSIICSPTAMFISKEGDNFWILKSNPRGITLPLFAKSLIGVLSSFVAVVASIVAICASGFVPWVMGLIILGLAIVYIFGLVAMGLILNLYRPNIFYLNHENNSNMLIHMIVSFILSMIIGIMSIILSFSIDILLLSLLCLIVVLLFTIVNVVLLLTQYKKLYARMEV